MSENCSKILFVFLCLPLSILLIFRPVQHILLQRAWQDWLWSPTRHGHSNTCKLCTYVSRYSLIRLNIIYIYILFLGKDPDNLDRAQWRPRQVFSIIIISRVWSLSELQKKNNKRVKHKNFKSKSNIIIFYQNIPTYLQ